MIRSLLLVYLLFSISVYSCPPGFIISPSNGEECTCQDDAYGGMIICTEEDHSENRTTVANVLRGTWLGNYTNTILAGVSPYLLYTSNDTVQLPNNWSLIITDNYMCEHVHRYGVLCGKCLPEYSQAINSYNCVSCTNKDVSYNWLLYVLLELVPMTLLFGLLLLFNIKITSGSGHAFIFYSQMITTTFDMSRDNVLGNVLPRPLIQAYRTLYGIWNLDFFSFLVSPFCIAKNMTAYDGLFVRFIGASYPLLLIVCFSLIVWAYDCGWRPLVVLLRPVHRCLAYVQQIGKFRASAINAFAVFLVLSYTKFVFVSFNILATNSLYDYEGNEIIHNLPLYDSTVSFFDRRIVWLFILTLFILIIFGGIFPFILLLPSLLHLMHKVSQKDCFSRCMPWGKMQEFLQQFHGCYKDGLTTSNSYDFRYFSAIFLFLRGIMFCLYSYTPSEGYQYALQTALCFLVTFLLAACRPFKETRDNVLNIGVFCLLGVNSVLMTFNYYEMLFGSVLLSACILQYLLTMLPLVLLIIYWSYRMFKKVKIWTFRSNGRLYVQRKHGLSFSNSFSSLPRSYTVWKVHDSINDDTNHDTDDLNTDCINDRYDSVDFIDFIEASGRLKTQKSRQKENEASESDKTSLISLPKSPSYRDNHYGSMSSSSNEKRKFK